MSGTFVNFLAKQVVNFFASREIQPGEKYHLQFEKESEVMEFIDSAINFADNNNLMRPFEWNIGMESYKSASICAKGQELLIAGTVKGVTEDFLIRIRNLVGTQDSLFKNKAVLFVHHTTLDSIIGGAVDLQHPSMPLSYQSIYNHIQQALQVSSLDRVSKSVINFTLNQIEETHSQEDTISIYEFKGVLPLLEEGISNDNFPQLDLFCDPQLKSYSIEEQQKRLKENHQLFRLIQDAHNYGDPQTDLEKEFDDIGLEKITKEDWKNLDFKFVKDSSERLEQVKPPEYQNYSLTQNLQKNGVSIKDQPEGETKARKRKRHILVFNPQKIEEIQLEFLFDQHLKKAYIKNMVGDSATTAGKKIVMYYKGPAETVQFIRFKYQDDKGANFDFKIAILPFSKSLFYSIDQYTIKVTKKTGMIQIPLKENTCILNGEEAQEYLDVKPSEFNQEFPVQPGKAIRINIPPETIQESEDEIDALLTLNGVRVLFKFFVEVVKPRALTGLEIYKIKREEKKDFIRKNNECLEQNGRQYVIKDWQLYQELLPFEEKMVEQQVLAMRQDVSGVYTEEIAVPAPVRQAYLDYVQYFNKHNLLPSLTSWNEELSQLATRYIQTYISSIDGLGENEPLPAEAKGLAYLGTVYSNKNFPTLMFSPLHPLNVAYQLTLEQEVGNEIIPPEILERLGANNLCPYIFYNGEIFKPIHQEHAPEWIYYRRNDEKRYHSPSNFVPKLVSDKIKEFTEHYSFLFDYNRHSPLKLNAINMGDCREVLQGIFRYYHDQLKKQSWLEHLIPIDIMIYGEGQQTAFEELSEMISSEGVVQAFGLHLKLNQFSLDDVIGEFRKKVRFYKRRIDSPTYEYAHISFYELDAIVDETSSQMDRIETGVGLNGLISSITSTEVKGSYRTGFGTKFLKENNQLIQLTKLLNSLAFASGKQNVYEKGKSIATAFSLDNNDTLTKVYQSSHWVTFVEPKFDLTFFERTDFGNDLLIIHYSDQLSSSNTYDAITVTQKTEQFKLMIEEFLREKIHLYDPQTTKRIINFFNSLNGNWLLRLIGNKGHFSKEKMSVLSAVKFILAYLADEDTLWMPISLEEILRVSGAVGLKKKGSPFSAKNLGVAGQQSDDLLMVGVSQKGENIQVCYYPVEVKIGRNQKNVIKKALDQVNRTYDTIYSKLTEQSFKGKVYRDFLIQLALVSAKKMDLYGIWPKYKWKRLFEENICTKLLSDDYDLVEPDTTYLGKGSIISFEKGSYFRDERFNDQVLMINLIEQDGFDFLGLDLGEIFNHLVSGHYEITKRVGSMREECEVSATIEKTKMENIDQNEWKDDDVIEYRENRLKNRTKNVSTGKEFVQSTGPMKILFGHSTGSRDPLYWYPTDTSKIMHTNTGIIGTMGTGKTQFTKSLITQIYRRQLDNLGKTPIDILIFDYKGDYIKSDFVKATNATVYAPHHLPFNPLALYRGQAFKPLLPLHTASTMKETIATVFGLGPKQQQLLNDLIMAAYEEKGIHKTNQDTWDRSAPTIYDVYRKFEAHEGAKEDLLYTALKQITSFELFHPDSKQTGTLNDMIQGVTVINLSGYDPSLQNLIVAITLDAFYSQMLTKGHSSIQGDYRELTKMILVDEADNFLSKNFASLKKIMKEGREFGVGVILSTQFMSHFATADNDYSQYILTWVVHRVSEIKKKEVQSIFNPENQNEIDQLMNKIRKLPKHHSLVTSVSRQKYTVMEDMPFWKLIQS